MAMLARKPLEKGVLAQLHGIAQCIHSTSRSIAAKPKENDQAVDWLSGFRQSVDLGGNSNIIVTEVRQLPR